jgi:hypothetical protein
VGHPRKTAGFSFGVSLRARSAPVALQKARTVKSSSPYRRSSADLADVLGATRTKVSRVRKLAPTEDRTWRIPTRALQPDRNEAPQAEIGLLPWVASDNILKTFEFLTVSFGTLGTRTPARNC